MDNGTACVNCGLPWNSYRCATCAMYASADNREEVESDEKRCEVCGGRLEKRLVDRMWVCELCNGEWWWFGFSGGERMEARTCGACGDEFFPKYHWAKLCWKCWLNTKGGKEWQQRKEAEANGFHQHAWGNEEEGARASGSSEGYRRAHDGRFREAYPDEAPAGIDKELLRKLLQLCHPDKHGGSELATSVTTRLLEMRRKVQ